MRLAIGAAVVAAALSAGAVHSMAMRFADPGETIQTRTAAQDAFADADYGVDPIATGPTSASFKRQQTEIGCAAAVWPNIPLACYPK